MKKTKKFTSKVLALLLCVVMIVTLLPISSFAEGSNEVPTAIKKTEKVFYDESFKLTFSQGTDAAWVGAISKVTVNGVEYEKASYSGSVTSKTTNYYNDSRDGYGEDPYIYIGAGYEGDNPATCVICATGYKDLTISLDKTSYTAAIVESKDGGDSGDNQGKGDDSSSTDKKDAPAAIKSVSSGWFYDRLELTFAIGTDTDWVSKITGMTVNGVTYEKAGYTGGVNGNTSYYADSKDGYGEDPIVYIGTGYEGENPATCVIQAEGYKDLTLKIDKEAKTAQIVENETPTPEQKEAPTASIAKVRDFNLDYYVISFEGADDYVSGISEVLVNGAASKEVSSTISLNDKTTYMKDTTNNQLKFATTSFSSNGTAALQSGDVITLKNADYKDAVLKVTIVGDSVTIAPDDGKGEEYELNVKMEGTFEAAIVGQEKYDGVTSASTSSSTNKNSNVKVYGALTKVGTTPTEDDWKLLDGEDSQVDVNGSKSYVTISPEGSGMKGNYSTLTSEITLSGTPQKAGSYEITVTVTDEHGREATSNALPFNVYDRDNTYLKDRLTLDNCTKTQDGKYMYDMEPWTMYKFSSDEADKETVTVPKDIKAWYGSHTSGTYGYLGYAIDQDKETTQTLIIPEGCDLTIVNMDIWSSVKIVVEKGAKLSLHDSVVQGMIEVQDGGTFSMNYDSFNETFLTGASICGQIVLKDGAIVDNAMIYSNANYLANGDDTSRHRTEPVVAVEGNVTFKGQVFIKGDDGAQSKTSPGQKGLSVTNGTLTLADGAVLAVYGGGDGSALTQVGADGIILDNGTITGNGKLIALGGSGWDGTSGNAISGTGTISTAEAYIQGGSSYSYGSSNPYEAGKAITDGITVEEATNAAIIDGQAWKSGQEVDITYWTDITTTPDLSKYPIPQKHMHKIELQNAKEATCEQAGYTGDEVCTVCKKTVKSGSVTKKLGHSYGAWNVTKKATATKVGTKQKTCTRCGQKVTQEIPATGITLLLPKATASGTKNTKLTWNKIPGATAYDIYWSYCDGKSSFKKVKTVKATQSLQFTHATKKNSASKYYVVAYKTQKGKKVTLATSKQIHVVTSGSKYTNPKAVSVKKATVALKVKKTSQIKASVSKQDSKKALLSHVALFRYYTDNSTIAAVDKNGKITAKRKGNCNIYVVANNGIYKAIKVTVK